MRTLVKPAALVETWFDLLRDDAQRALARQLRDAVQSAEPRLAQTVKWGNLVFTFGGGNLLAICAHRSHVNLQVFNGAALAAQWPRLEGTGKGLRHVKFRHGQPVDTALVGALVRNSVAAAG